MTESAIPFGSDQPLAGDDADSTGGSRSRRPLLFAAAAILLALAVGAYFFVLSGGDTPVTKTAAAVVPHKPAGAVKPTPSTSPVPTPAVAPAVPPAVTQPLGRDPFKPLYVAPAVAVAAAPGAGAPGVAALAGSPATSTALKAGATTVTLVTVATVNGRQVAQTKVGETSYAPAVGDVFAKTYKLVSIAGSCATYLNGDERFALCPGQTFTR